MTHRIASLFAAGIAVTLLLAPGRARAETVYATSDAPIYDRPGEMARIVTRVSRGAKMKVLRRPKGDTRWYKVRVNGRTGWVPRSKVSSHLAARSRRSHRKRRRHAFVEGRSRERGALDEDAPSDRVGADTVVEEEEDDVITEDGDSGDSRASDAEEDFEEEDVADEGPDEGEDEANEDEAEERPGAMILKVSTAIYEHPNHKSNEVSSLETGDRVYLVRESKSGRWLKVETESGAAGWLRASKVEAEAFRRPKYAVDLRANVGLSLLSQSFKSNGPEANDLSAYGINASTLGVALGGLFVYDYKPSWLLAADISYRYGRASPGIRYNDGINSTDIPFTTHDFDIGARAGYKLGKTKSMALYGRVGYSYYNFSVDNFDDAEKNPLLLPNETVGAFVLGLRFQAPSVYNKFGIDVGADYMLPAQRKQTKNLTDGDTADVKGYDFGFRVAYHWKPRWDLSVAYTYTSYSTDFSGMATRPTDATEAERTDKSHIFLLGLARSLF